jgi:ribosomal-protein-alanine N-acetyltransferase
MSQEISYRKPTVKDYKRLDYINTTCLPENYPLDQWEFMLKLHADYCKIAINENGEIIGYVICVYEGEKAIIPSLAVLPDYRSKGVGKNLLLKSILELRKVHKECNIFLHCRVTNTVALELYSKFNFEIKGRVKDYYSNPTEDAYELSRK